MILLSPLVYYSLALNVGDCVFLSFANRCDCLVFVKNHMSGAAMSYSKNPYQFFQSLPDDSIQVTQYKQIFTLHL